MNAQKKSSGGTLHLMGSDDWWGWWDSTGFRIIGARVGPPVQHGESWASISASPHLFCQQSFPKRWRWPPEVLADWCRRNCKQWRARTCTLKILISSTAVTFCMNRINIVVLTKVNGYIMGEETNIWFCCSMRSTEITGSWICFLVTPWTF